MPDGRGKWRRTAQSRANLSAAVKAVHAREDSPYKTEECRQKRVEKLKARNAKPPSWKGVVKSPEHIQKIRDARDLRSLHPEYTCWYDMMYRCHIQPHEHYEQRGIQVCEEWHDPHKFFEYLDSELGSRPEGHQLDRIDNDGNYEPGNIRWASRSQQIQNRRYLGRRASA